MHRSRKKTAIKLDMLLSTENPAATSAFVLNSPFQSALARIRRAIRDAQLCVAAEIDAAQRVKRALQIYVSPCRVLLVDNPLFMLETTAIDRASGIFVPLHLVVSGAGNRTLIYMLSPEHIRRSDLSIGVKAPVLDLQRQVQRVLAAIADKPRFLHSVADTTQTAAEPG